MRERRAAKRSIAICHRHLNCSPFPSQPACSWSVDSGQLAENKALGPLADEFARTDMEISHLGVSRVDALDHMRRRCDSPLMGYFCAALIEATRKGTSISGVLESQAKLARKARYDALTAQINKLSTKMAVPLVFFLIAVLVLILPPLIIPTASMLMEIM